MATVDTQLSLSAPVEINIPLVRADHLSTSNVFRILFEMFLAISSALISVILSSNTANKIHWAFFGVTSLSSFLFLALSVWFSKRARSGT